MLDFAFAHTLGRLPHFRRFAPDIEIVGDSEAVVRDALAAHRRALGASGREPDLLDVGARDAKRAALADGYRYHGMDIAPRVGAVETGDICACPEIASDSFDAVLSFDVLEHVREPWAAAAESVRIARPGGLIVHRSLFAYRYHPEPVDYWRFTAQGLEHLCTRGGAAETIAKGYDIRGRRRNRRGVFVEHRPPIDWLGGFRENWQVLWIGRKLGRASLPD